MERGASPVLATRIGRHPREEAPTLRRLPGPRTAEAVDAPLAPRGRLRRLLAVLGDSCALAAVALVSALAVVAVGTIGSLLWMLLLER